MNSEYFYDEILKSAGNEKQFKLLISVVPPKNISDFLCIKRMVEAKSYNPKILKTTINAMFDAHIKKIIKTKNSYYYDGGRDNVVTLYAILKHIQINKKVIKRVIDILPFIPHKIDYAPMLIATILKYKISSDEAYKIFNSQWESLSQKNRQLLLSKIDGGIDNKNFCKSTSKSVALFVSGKTDEEKPLKLMKKYILKDIRLSSFLPRNKKINFTKKDLEEMNPENRFYILDELLPLSYSSTLKMSELLYIKHFSYNWGKTTIDILPVECMEKLLFSVVIDNDTDAGDWLKNYRIFVKLAPRSPIAKYFNFMKEESND